MDVYLTYNNEDENFVVFVNGERYFEGDYMECCGIMDSFYYPDDDDRIELR